MGKFVSRRAPVSSRALKRKPHGTVAVHHNGTWENVRFTRVHGGWLRESDVTSERVVTSVQVAAECNKAFGFKESWACIY